MSDFLLTAGADDPAKSLTDLLADIPSVNARSPDTFHSGSAEIAIRAPNESRLTPYQTKTGFAGVVGRPILTGKRQEDSVCRTALRKFEESGESTDFLDRLSGIFTLLIAVEDNFYLVTDPLGSLPVYAAEAQTDGLVFGSHPEIVAQVAGLEKQFDRVSLARFLVESRITYPFTTREGMIELAPGAIYSLNAECGESLEGLNFTRYWIPREPTSPPDLRELQEELYRGCLQAARELARGQTNVTVSLSGGSDSRAIVGAFERGSDIELSAVTAADYDNRELRLAREIAKRSEISHRTLWRSRQHYAGVFERAIELNGYENSFQDAHLIDLIGDMRQARLLVSGAGADTLLKGEYSEKIPSRMVVDQFQSFVSGRQKPSRATFEAELREKDTLGVSDELLCRVAERKWRRFDELRKIRPDSAREWCEIYPMSRRKAISSTLTNRRLTCSDEFYHHRAIIEVAARASTWDKVSRRLTTPVYKRLAPDLMSLKDANNGLPASSPWFIRDVATVIKVLHRRGREWVQSNLNILLDSDSPFDGQPPWFTHKSWISFQQFMKYSAAWYDVVESIDYHYHGDEIEEILGDQENLIDILSCDVHSSRQRGALAQIGHMTGSYSSRQ